jgi:hypothetical protein
MWKLKLALRLENYTFLTLWIMVQTLNLHAGGELTDWLGFSNVPRRRAHDQTACT